MRKRMKAALWASVAVGVLLTAAAAIWPSRAGWTLAPLMSLTAFWVGYGLALRERQKARAVYVQATMPTEREDVALKGRRGKKPYAESPPRRKRTDRRESQAERREVNAHRRPSFNRRAGVAAFVTLAQICGTFWLGWEAKKLYDEINDGGAS